MLKYFWTLILFTVSLHSVGHAAPPMCLSRHIQDAIELNKNRETFYSYLTNGRSRGVSEAFISMEESMLNQAKVADLLAYHWQSYGLDIMCDEFIDMSNTPSFKAYFADKSPLKKMNFNLNQANKKQLEKLVRDENFEKLNKHLDTYLVALSKEPRTHCLTRHFLESMRRVSSLIPKHAETARRLKISSALFLSKQVLRSHIENLDAAQEIDELALPVQAMMVPMICQDVPNISH